MASKGLVLENVSLDLCLIHKTLWPIITHTLYVYTEKTKIYEYKHVNINIAIQWVLRRYNLVNAMKFTLK